MDGIFKWRDEWLLGIPTLDDQHRVLADCLNRLVNECASLHGPDGDGDPARKETLLQLMEELCERTRRHFAVEEDMMLEAEYPGYAHHQREHVMLLAELKATFAARVREGRCNMSPEILRALKSWFIVHVASSDREFARWLDDRDTPAAPPGKRRNTGKPLYHGGSD